MKKIEVLSKAWMVAALLLLVGSIATTTMTSCGSSNGGSDGGLCEQCGVTDGPCQATALVRPGANEPEDCSASPSPGQSPCVDRGLICRRKSDSAQQRCYPVDPNDSTNPDFGFICDGSRPGGTAQPQPTLTTTPAPSSTPSTCNNGILDSGEQCDGTIIANGLTCANFCAIATGGTLSCNTNCTINSSGCLGTACQ